MNLILCKVTCQKYPRKAHFFNHFNYYGYRIRHLMLFWYFYINISLWKQLPYFSQPGNNQYWCSSGNSKFCFSFLRGAVLNGSDVGMVSSAICFLLFFGGTRYLTISLLTCSFSWTSFSSGNGCVLVHHQQNDHCTPCHYHRIVSYVFVFSSYSSYPLFNFLRIS